MLIRGEQLTASLVAAGLPVVGTASPPAVHETSGPGSTFHTRPVEPLLVRVDWSQAPTAPQTAQADAVVQAHDDAARVVEEVVDNPAILGRQSRLIAALTLRASSGWAGMPAARRTRIMAVIDAAADRIIAALAGST